MAEVLLFHHAHGRTRGVESFAQVLRDEGHVVHVPDLFDGHTFHTLDSGVAYAKEVGFGELMERGIRAADNLPAELVYAGFSLGVMPAQQLAQTRRGAKGALLFHACLPTSEFGPWPEGLAAQIHSMEEDPFFVDDGDIDAARALVNEASSAQMFLYPGAEHLFADPSLSSYDAEAAALLRRRVVEFLANL